MQDVTCTAAEVAINVPELDGPLALRIVVPGKEDGRRRVCIVAKVIAESYARSLRRERFCLWCGETPEGGMVYWLPGPVGAVVSEAPPGWYCNGECWLSAS